MKKPRQKAFTITEILVVVAIIGIIMAIVTSKYSVSKEKTRDAKRVSNVMQLQHALSQFFYRCNQYPLRHSPLIVGTPNMPILASPNGCPPGITLASFTSKIPANDTNEYNYLINNSTTPTDYVFRVKLEGYNPVLADDIDTDLPAWAAGFVCTDPVGGPYYYCVRPI